MTVADLEGVLEVMRCVDCGREVRMAEAVFDAVWLPHHQRCLDEKEYGDIRRTGELEDA